MYDCRPLPVLPLWRSFDIKGEVSFSFLSTSMIGGVWIGILSSHGRIGSRGFHWLELDGAKGGQGKGDRGDAGWARFIDENRELRSQRGRRGRLGGKDRNGGGKHGGYANSGKVEEEDYRGGGEGRGREDGKEDESTHGGDDGEADVISEEAGEAVVVEYDEKSSDSGDEGHESDSVEEGADEAVEGGSEGESA